MKLTKTFLTIGLSAFVAATTFAGDALQQYVPKKANVIMSINFKKLLNLPLMKKIRKENPDAQKSWDEIKKTLQKYSLKPGDVFQRMLIFSIGKDSGAILIETKVTEAQFNKISEDNTFDKQASLKTETIGGKKTYIFQRKSQIPGGQLLGKMTGKKKEDIALQFLKPGLVFITAKKNLASISQGFAKHEKSPLLAKKSLIKNSDDTILWVLFNVPPKAKTAQPAPQRGPMGGIGDGITSGVLALDFTGENNGDFTALINLNCKDAQTVNKMTMQLQMGLMGLTGMVFKDTPDVGMAISKAIKIKPNGKDLSISILLPKTLQDKIEKSLKDAQAKAAQAKAAQQQGPAPKK